ncbi:MAG TPA: hypothetical protein VMM38_01470 [Aridibacter sp.]|nr:hypothetical protein [Aridibacter sp.]
MAIDLIIICLGLLVCGMLIGCPIAYRLGYRKANREFYDPGHWLSWREKRLETRDILNAEVIE